MKRRAQSSPTSARPFTIFTIGYEKRTGAELIRALKKAGIEYLADVRENPISRKPEFRAKALRALVERAGIEYGPWPTLGAPKAMRDRLKASGNLKSFLNRFRTHVTGKCNEPLDELSAIAKTRRIALLCYERAHEECHRSVIAELLAAQLRATIVAIP